MTAHPVPVLLLHLSNTFTAPTVRTSIKEQAMKKVGVEMEAVWTLIAILLLLLLAISQEGMNSGTDLHDFAVGYATGQVCHDDFMAAYLPQSRPKPYACPQSILERRPDHAALRKWGTEDSTHLLLGS